MAQYQKELGHWHHHRGSLWLHGLNPVSICYGSCQLLERETTGFLKKLASHDKLSANTIVPTMDGLQVIKNIILNEGTASSFIKLYYFVLTHNYFRSVGSLFLKVNSTAIGICMASQYASRP